MSGQKGKASFTQIPCKLATVEGNQVSLVEPHPSSYLLLKGPFQGLHLHLLLPEARVESRTLSLCFCSNLSNLFIGSVDGVLFAG